MKRTEEGTLKEMEAMRREGKTLEEIGEKYHRNRQAIHNLFKRYSIVVSKGYFRWRCEKCNYFNERDYNLFIEKARFGNEKCDKCRTKRIETDGDKFLITKT